MEARIETETPYTKILGHLNGLEQIISSESVVIKDIEPDVAECCKNIVKEFCTKVDDIAQFHPFVAECFFGIEKKNSVLFYTITLDENFVKKYFITCKEDSDGNLSLKDIESLDIKDVRELVKVLKEDMFLHNNNLRNN